MKVPLALVAFLALQFAGPDAARGDPFLYAPCEREQAALPARYRPPLPMDLIVNPSLARLEGHFHVIHGGPKHLAHRSCRDGAPEREWILDAMRRAANAGRWPEDPLRLHLALPGCVRPEDAASLCRFLLDAAADEAAGPLRRFLVWRVANCAGPEAAPFFARRDQPDEAVIAYREHNPDLGVDDRLEEAVRALARGADLSAFEQAVHVLGRTDEPRVAQMLLALYAEVGDPDRRRILGIGLREQSDPRAQEVFAAEYRADCERLKAARERAKASKSTGPDWSGRGYASKWLVGCSLGGRGAMSRLTPRSSGSPGAPPRRPPDPDTLRIQSIEAALRSRGHDTKVFTFMADEASLYGEHAYLLRKMADLVSPRLDDVTFDEAWPAVDAVDLDRGPHAARAVLRNDAFDVRVGDRDGAPDQSEAEAIAEELASAFAEPHRVDAYIDGERFRFAVRGLGPYVDVEALVGTENALLRARDSDWRFIVLDGFYFVALVAGPRNVLLDAIEAGAFRPGDPFAAARKDPEFDPALLGDRDT
jgi:hypothetical protein